MPFATTNPDGPWTDFDPPTGVVTVEGKIQASQVRSTGLIGGPKDADEGRLTTLVARRHRSTATPGRRTVAARVDRPHDTGSRGRSASCPSPVPAPDLTEGPHLNYAGQWFIFATLTVIVYPLLMRRIARNKGIERATAADAATDVRDELDTVS